MTEAPLRTTSPVFQVGGELTRDLARDCLALDVQEDVAGLRRLEASFLAVGAGATGPQATLLYLDGRTIDLGSELKVALGGDDEQRFVFEGTVSAIELVLDNGEPPRVVVLAEDALMGLRMTRRLRTWVQVTDADLASGIASEHGLQADTAVDGPTYDIVQQLNQSDLAFLRERARLVQAEIWCTGRTLHFRTRPRRQTTEVTLVLGRDLLSARLCADLAHQRSEVHVSGYDADQKQVVDERAGPDAVTAESGGGRTGADLVDRALGTATTLRVREAPLTSAEASAWAAAEMLRRGRRFVTVSGETNGTPDMIVGTRLNLDGVGEPFQGDGYYVTGIQHRFDLRRGFRTSFRAERATLNEVR